MLNWLKANFSTLTQEERYLLVDELCALILQKRQYDRFSNPMSVRYDFTGILDPDDIKKINGDNYLNSILFKKTKDDFRNIPDHNRKIYDDLTQHGIYTEGYKKMSDKDHMRMKKPYMDPLEDYHIGRKNPSSDPYDGHRKIPAESSSQYRT